MSDKRVSKKRNKPIKSCLTCRAKKQKCDHTKPQCYQCLMRNTKCIYLNDGIDSDGSRGDATTKSAHAGKSGISTDLDSHLEVENHNTEEPNSLKGSKLLFRKNDTWIACGVTSMRTVLHLHCDNKFNGYFNAAWTKLKEERTRWKAKNDYSSLREWTVLRDRDVIKNGESLVDAVCRVLPSYERIQTHLKTYFEGPRHRIFEIVDPKKVLRDFESCFIKGSLDSRKNGHSVVDLVPSKSHNFHCMGVVIEIMRTTFYSSIPKELDIFSGYLSSAASEKALSIEKLQCIMLKAFHLDFLAMTGGDFSRVYMLIQMACSLAIDLGFNSELSIPTNTNDRIYLENLWWWLLHMDIEVSFNLGVPLQMGSVSSSRLLPSQNIIFTKSIILLRKVQQDIYCKDNMPDLKQLIMDIKAFIHVHFKPLSFYMVPENYNFTEGLEVHTLLSLLTAISNLSNIRRYYLNESTPETFNTTIQVSFTSLQISITVLKSYYEMDLANSNHGLDDNTKEIPLHLQTAGWITYQTLGRVVYESYGILFSTFQESMPTSLGTDESTELQVSDLSIGSLDVNINHIFSLKAVSQMLNSIFDSLYSVDSGKLLGVIKKSYCFLLILSLEKVSRRVLENGIMAKESSKLMRAPVQSGELDESLDMIHGGQNITINSEHQPADFFWDQCDNYMTTWIENDLETCFSELFGNLVE